MNHPKRFIGVAALVLLFLTAAPRAVAAGGSGYVLIDASDHRVLFQQNARERLPMASTTKVMTALLALENIPLDLEITVSEECTRVEGSSMYLRAGDRLTVRDLLYGLMLVSGNDAALALACAVAGTPENFITLMNEKAYELGARDTHFDNPHGLHSSEHYTTAYDLALICSYAMKNEVFAEIVATADRHIFLNDGADERYLHNKNKLLTAYNGANGIKIGYTRAAGRCLCASARRDGRLLICVILNDPNWFATAAALFDRAFAQG